jgi:hypothetical protein
MRPHLRSKHSLSKQLFKSIFGPYCIIAIFMTAIQIVEEYRYTQKAITTELKNIRPTTHE